MLALLESFLVALILTILPLTARERIEKLGWNPNPSGEGIVKYEVFRGLNKLGESTTLTLDVRLPFDQCTVTVRAVNAAGTFSPMSAPLTIPSVWSEIKVTMQFSRDLKSWGEKFLPSSRFACAQIITP